MYNTCIEFTLLLGMYRMYWLFITSAVCIVIPTSNSDWFFFLLLIAKSKAIAIFVHDLNLQNFLYCRGYFTLYVVPLVLCFPPLSQASWLFQKDWITASTIYILQLFNKLEILHKNSFLFSTSDKDIPSAAVATVNLSPSSRIHKKKPKACNQNHIISGFSKTKKHACPTCIQHFKLVFQFWMTFAPLGLLQIGSRLEVIEEKNLAASQLLRWFCTQLKVFSNVLPFFSLSEEAYAREDFY